MSDANCERCGAPFDYNTDIYLCPLCEKVNEMKKHQERTDLRSCFNRAKEDELMFVLLGRDAAAPAAIRAWVKARVDSEKNKFDDAQIIEALAIARQIELEHPDFGIKDYTKDLREKSAEPLVRVGAGSFREELISRLLTCLEGVRLTLEEHDRVSKALTQCLSNPAVGSTKGSKADPGSCVTKEAASPPLDFDSQGSRVTKVAPPEFHAP